MTSIKLVIISKNIDTIDRLSSQDDTTGMIYPFQIMFKK